MRVTHNTFPQNLQVMLQQAQRRMTQLHQQASSGQRIQRSSDDPSAASQTLAMQTEKSRLSQYHRNIAKAGDIVNATVAEMRQMVRLSERAGEIAVLSTDIVGHQGMMAYARELDQQIEQLVQMGNRRFNGEYIFGGKAYNTPPFVPDRDAEGRIVSLPAPATGEGIAYPVADGTNFSPYAGESVRQAMARFINRLVELRDSLDQDPPVAASQAMRTALQESEDDLILALAGTGALQTRLELITSSNQLRFTDLETHISQVADADLAQTLVQLNQSQTSYQAALQGAGRVLELTLLHYIR